MDDNNEDYYTKQRIVQERKQQNLQRQALYAKNLLKEQIQKRIKTTMIGALASFEEHFGVLIGLDAENPTEKQEKLCEIWDEVRQDILDKGNKQIRSALEELDCYDIRYNGHEYKFDLRRGT